MSDHRLRENQINLWNAVHEVTVRTTDSLAIQYMMVGEHQTASKATLKAEPTLIRIQATKLCWRLKQGV